MLNLSMILEEHARRNPEREAVVMGSTRLGYGQLNALACQVANGLSALGIQPGDRVALSCPNLPYFPIVYFGILKAGAVVVPLNVLLRGPEVAFHLQDSGARAFFCFEGTPELPMARMGQEGFEAAPACEHFFVITSDPAAPPPVPGARTLGMLLHQQPPTFRTAARDPDDTAVILYTSGTTGRPKGAELTHDNMLLNAIASRDLSLPELPRDEQPVTLVALPLFHSFGQTVQMNAGLYNGSKLVLVPRFEPGTVLDLMVKERVHLFAGVPTMFWALLNHARQHGVDPAPIAENLILCNSGGAPLPVELLRAFEETFAVKILEGYGLSETSPVATFNQLDRPRKVGSIGLPIFGVEVRVVNDRFEDVPTGEPGEIVIRGANVMKGYHNRPEANAEAFQDGWFRTGDIGPHGRGRLPLHHGPGEGHDHPRADSTSTRARSRRCSRSTRRSPWPPWWAFRTRRAGRRSGVRHPPSRAPS